MASGLFDTAELLRNVPSKLATSIRIGIDDWADIGGTLHPKPTILSLDVVLDSSVPKDRELVYFRCDAVAVMQPRALPHRDNSADYDCFVRDLEHSELIRRYAIAARDRTGDPHMWVNYDLLSPCDIGAFLAAVRSFVRRVRNGR
jgi:hypothetical protein